MYIITRKVSGHIYGKGDTPAEAKEAALAELANDDILTVEDIDMELIPAEKAGPYDLQIVNLARHSQ